MAFDGDPLYIEIPNDSDLIADGANKNSLRNGGNYCYCIENDLNNNPKVKIIFVLIDND